MVKDKRLLNKKLETITIPDPVFSKLGRFISEPGDPNKLHLINLPTKLSLFDLEMDEKFFDREEYEHIEFADDDDYDEIMEGGYRELPFGFNLDPQLTIRQNLHGYKIKNTPFDDDGRDLADDGDDAYS